jgi:hypothetical protein
VTALVSWGGDAVPEGVLLEPVSGNRYCTRQRAEALDAQLREAAGEMARAARRAVPLLAEIRANNAWVQLGWSSYWLYVADVFQDLRELRLNGSDEAVQERRALVGSMVDDGLSITDIQRKLDYSRGTVAADRRAHLGTDAPTDVTDIEPPAELPTPTGPVWVQALTYLARQDDRGLTRLELAAEAGWSDGKAGSALIRLRRKRAAVNPDGATRLDYEVFTVTDLGRATLEEQQ